MRLTLRSLYDLINRFLSVLGLRLIRSNTAVDFRTTLGNLRAAGFEPAVVFDIGVARGTPELYSAFRGAHFHLVDPLPDSLPHMQRWAERLRAEVANVALGAEDGQLDLDIRSDLGGSTLYEDIGQAPSLGRVQVPVRRFDRLYSRDQLSGRVLVKIDVQGAELDVLRGMGGLIEDIDILIVEVSTIVAWRDAPHMDDVTDYLKACGFVLYDICGILRRPLDNALAQLDLAFCKASSPLVADRRWG